MYETPVVSDITFVNAAVSVVFPWSTWPIVPTFTCGFVRSNFCFAIGLLLCGVGDARARARESCVLVDGLRADERGTRQCDDRRDSLYVQCSQPTLCRA